MGLQLQVNNKTPAQIQFEIEQELIGINPYYFERDKETIIFIYMDLFEDLNHIPRFTQIEQKIAELNYDICYRASVVEFETYYESDAIGSMMSSYMCSSYGELEQYIDVTGVITSEIDYLTREMFNDVCSSRTRDIEDCIKQALDRLDVVYEDDTEYHPLSSEILFNKDEHCILVNDAQLTMFPGIHADEYGYDINAIYDDCDDISNCIVRRRRKIPNSRLIRNGGD